MKLLERCPERFRRRYLCGEREPANGPMLVGRAVGQAVTAYYAACDWPLSSPEGWWSSASMCAFWESCEGGGPTHAETGDTERSSGVTGSASSCGDGRAWS
jgi:hypothetical protein